MFYVPFSNQGHSGTVSKHCHLWESKPQQDDSLWLVAKPANPLRSQTINQRWKFYYWPWSRSKSSFSPTITGFLLFGPSTINPDRSWSLFKESAEPMNWSFLGLSISPGGVSRRQGSFSPASLLSSFSRLVRLTPEPRRAWRGSKGHSVRN